MHLVEPAPVLVDIIVRAKNGHELVDACIGSIVDNTPPEQYRMILVDDGSEPPLASKYADTIIRSAKCKGAVTATNMGIALALLRLDAEHALILDNDTEIPDGDNGWLERMVAELEQGGPRTACVGATTNYANPPQHILASPQTYKADWTSEDGQRLGMKQNPAVSSFVSFAVLFRKVALRSVGVWDERYNPGNFEDTDYAVQCRVAGWDIRVARSVYIHHHGHQTFREEIGSLLKVNGVKFVEKWGVGRLYDLGMVDPAALKASL